MDSNLIIVNIYIVKWGCQIGHVLLRVWSVTLLEEWKFCLDSDIYDIAGFHLPHFVQFFFYKHPFILIKMLFLNFRFIYRLIISHYNLDHNQTMDIPLSYIAFAGYIIKEMNEISFLFNMIISNDGWYFGPIQDAIIKIQPSCNTEHKQTSKQKN